VRTVRSRGEHANVDSGPRGECNADSSAHAEEEEKEEEESEESSDDAAEEEEEEEEEPEDVSDVLLCV